MCNFISDKGLIKQEKNIGKIYNLVNALFREMKKTGNLKIAYDNGQGVKSFKNECRSI